MINAKSIFKFDTTSSTATFNDADIKRIEKKLGGYKISELYKQLIPYKNGADLKKKFFIIKDDDGNVQQIVRCSGLYGLSDEKQYCGILSSDHFNKVEDGKVFSAYDYEMDGFSFGLFVPNSGWGDCYFYFDYSECGKQGEPRVCVYVMKWSHEHSQAIPHTYVVAKNFETYLNGLVSKVAVEPFDYVALEKNLEVAVKQSCEQFKSGEQIGAYGLYTDDEGTFIATSANTKENVEEYKLENPKDKFGLYITAEWEYEGTERNEGLATLTSQLEDYVAMLPSDSVKAKHRRQLLESMANVLLKLRGENLFEDIFGEQVILMVGTAHDDMSLALFKKYIKMLNPKG